MNVFNYQTSLKNLQTFTYICFRINFKLSPENAKNDFIFLCCFLFLDLTSNLVVIGYLTIYLLKDVTT
jgi:hypothetical protein